MATYPDFPLVSQENPYGRISPGSALAHTPRVLKANFGNGYSQRTGDGFNTDQRTLTARFENLNTAEAQIIEDFLRARAGVQPFWHHVPSSGGTEKALFTCDDWSRSFNDPEYETVTATFVECFDP